MKRLTTAVLMLLVATMVVAEPQNPPPVNALAGYDKYELSPIAMGPPYAGDAGKEKAKAKIQDHLSTEIDPVIAQWNAEAAGGARGQSLLIEPRIDKLKVVSGGARFWAGALAGDSYVVMKLRISEQPSGVLVAEPEFYQRAAAMSGAWTFGGQDKDMMHRIALITKQYLLDNYKQAVGGATGYVPQ